MTWAGTYDIENMDIREDTGWDTDLENEGVCLALESSLN